MKKSEEVRKVIEDYLSEVMPYHPALPAELWEKIDKVLEVTNE